MSELTIREAKQEDLPGIARVRVDTWKATYRGMVPDDFLDGMSYQATAEGWQKNFWDNRDPGTEVFIAVSDRDGIVGVAICGLERNMDPLYRAEIYVLYVLPEYQNRGIGRRLVGACVLYIREQLGMQSMLIWVLAENPYRRFYESLGGKMVREKNKEIGGRMLPEVGYGWESIQDIQWRTYD